MMIICVNITGKRRNNCHRFCIYSNSPLPNVTERLFFILVYLKNNPLQECHAACFGYGSESLQYLYSLFGVSTQFRAIN